MAFCSLCILFQIFRIGRYNEFLGRYERVVLLCWASGLDWCSIVKKMRVLIISIGFRRRWWPCQDRHGCRGHIFGGMIAVSVQLYVWVPTKPPLPNKDILDFLQFTNKTNSKFQHTCHVMKKTYGSNSDHLHKSMSHRRNILFKNFMTQNITGENYKHMGRIPTIVTSQCHIE